MIHRRVQIRVGVPHHPLHRAGFRQGERRHHVRVQVPRVGVFIGIDHGVVADAVLDILQRVHGVRRHGGPSQLREQPDLQPPQHLLLRAVRLDQQMQGAQVGGVRLILAAAIDDQLRNLVIDGGRIAHLRPGAIGRQLRCSNVGTTGRKLGTHQRRAGDRVDVQVEPLLARKLLRQAELQSFGTARALGIGGRTLEGHHPQLTFAMHRIDRPRRRRIAGRDQSHQCHGGHDTAGHLSALIEPVERVHGRQSTHWDLTSSLQVRLEYRTAALRRPTVLQNADGLCLAAVSGYKWLFLKEKFRAGF